MSGDFKTRVSFPPKICRLFWGITWKGDVYQISVLLLKPPVSQPVTVFCWLVVAFRKKVADENVYVTNGTDEFCKLSGVK